MSYLVKALIRANGETEPGKNLYWAVNQHEWVDDVCIDYYLDHSDAFAVIDGPTFNDSFLIKSAVFPGNMAAAYIDFNGVGEAEMTVTIGGVVYTEADTAVPATGVFTNGASAADSATSLIAAINGDARTTVPFTAVADVSGDGAWLFWDAIGVAGNVDITTTSASNCTVDEASLGGAASAIKQQVSIVHTATAQELLSGAIEIPAPFTPTVININAFTSTGAPVYFTDLVTIEEDPDRIRIATTGATNIAATNVIHLTITE